jgi:hypothetical protein
VLDALLASVAGELSQASCLDLTTDGVGAAVLGARDLACAAEPTPGAGYGLVICDRSSLAYATAVLDPHGSLLAFVDRSDRAELDGVVPRGGGGWRRGGGRACLE